MKVALLPQYVLDDAGRWDIDFHTPALGIQRYANNSLMRIDEVADIGKEKRDPTEQAEAAFQYIDIASVDTTTGAIVSPQDLIGDEAPSRARKVVGAFDVIVSTCRPTRGAIAVVQPSLHNQIASTAFTIVRAKSGVNPYYLQFVLRLSSTREQFRKWSTGSSYPAILDEDVKKTLVPMLDTDGQDAIAAQIRNALLERERAVARVNKDWNLALDGMTANIADLEIKKADISTAVSAQELMEQRASFPPLVFSRTVR